jgi:alpha-L-fucosidase
MKLNPIKLIVLALGCSLATALAQTGSPQLLPIADGPFKPDWNSLTNYQTPEWFRDAKFGIWAHWGPQCQPEHGDWYAHYLYDQSHRDYRSHLAEYGHPSTNGFKEVIRDWKAEQFDPDKLLAFYKKNGARYFMAMASHHDNFDNFDSKYQPWNSVAIGPHKDLIGGWAAAARKNGLRFAVSVHCAYAWTFYETSQGADTNGLLAGVPYDGKLTKADGKGQWWEGLDPQDLYAQNHPLGASPDSAYMNKFFKRVRQLWDDYRPDQIYFDDDVLPFYKTDPGVGLSLAAHFYNSRLDGRGRTEAVINGKHLDDQQRQALLLDMERGKADSILPQPWQTDTCLGDWHYDRAIFQRHQYKTAPTVIRMLVDIVSKNGNLMLNVPLQRGGQPDSDEMKIVSQIGDWLRINGEAIYATRPWKIYGEGPMTGMNDHHWSGGQSDVQNKPFTAEDIRFTQSKNGKTLYAIVMAAPAGGQITIKTLAANSPDWPGKIGGVRLLGDGGKLKFTRDENGLHVTLPAQLPSQVAFALKIRS